MALLDRIKKYDNLYFALRNPKVVIGLAIFLFFILFAIIGPLFAHYNYEEMAGKSGLPPQADYPFGTEYFGRDLYSQISVGLGSSLAIGFVGGTIATVIGLVIGFISGYKGKWLDESLMMITNVFLVIPTIALLIIVGAYISVRGVAIQSILIGLVAWPWTARAVRAQTLSLKSKEFVDLSRISSAPTLKIISQDIAINMFSYVFMVYILQFNGAILASVTLDFIGLGPTSGISLGLVLFNAQMGQAIALGLWWWYVIPGVIITLLITSLYLVNLGMDEVFNPRLREM
jgi:peptide/nickel transport system permease protein